MDVTCESTLDFKVSLLAQVVKNIRQFSLGNISCVQLTFPLLDESEPTDRPTELVVLKEISQACKKEK